MTQTIVSERARAWDKELQALENEAKRIVALSTAMGIFLRNAAIDAERSSMELLKAEAAGVGLIHRAAVENNVIMMEYFLQAGANVNTTTKEGITPLHIAVSGGYLPMIKVLLESGADPHAKDAKGKTPLERSANRNIRQLLQRAAGIELLEDVLQRGDIKEIKQYLKKNPNSVNSMAFPALHNAATVEIAKELLKAGAPINGTDSASRTALKFFIEKSNKEMCEFLMAEGAVIDSRDIKAMRGHFGHEFTKDMAPSYQR